MLHLIDSNVDVLDVSRQIFAFAGFESISFDSPVSYLEYANSEKFVPAMAMVTCYQMPQIDGFRLIAEVRKKRPLQKAMMITGSPTNDAPADAEHLVCLHLLKPYKSEEVIATLKTLNLCDNTSGKKNGSTFKKSCKFGLNHECPFYAVQ